MDCSKLMSTPTLMAVAMRGAMRVMEVRISVLKISTEDSMVIIGSFRRGNVPQGTNHLRERIGVF